MAATNTGKKIFANLQQIFNDTGLPTGESDKANDPDDVDYIPPVVDLDTCPLPVPEIPPVIELTIRFVNNTTQSMMFSNFIVKKASAIDVLDTYFHNNPFSLLPGQIFDATIVLQTEDLSHLSFSDVNLSAGLTTNMDVNFKVGSEPTGTSIFNNNFVLHGSIDTPLVTTRDLSADMTNNLVITFSIPLQRFDYTIKNREFRKSKIV